MAVPRAIDWDGVLTFALTVGVIAATAGIAFVLTFRHVYRVATTSCESVSSRGLILVPGKQLKRGRPDPDFAKRLLAAADLAGQPQESQIIIMGGITGDASVTEAEAGERFLRQTPVGTQLSIRREATSRNTLTNLRNLRALLGDRRAGTKVLIISNRYHLARIGHIAESLSIPHVLWPAEESFTPTVTTWGKLLSESLYTLWFLVGKSWAHTIRNRRMLARIS